MGCGCKKNVKPSHLPAAAEAPGVPAPTAARVAVYEVVKDGSVVLSTTNPVAARQESSRSGASLRVTSRAVDVSAGEPVPA